MQRKLARLDETGGEIVELLELLNGLNVGGQIALGIVLFFVLYIILYSLRGCH